VANDVGEPIANVTSDEHEQRLTVGHALADLQKQIDSFQKEVDLCERERLGRVEKATSDLKRGLVFVAEQNSREYPSFQCGLPASNNT